MRSRLMMAVVLLLAVSALAADPGTPGGLPPGAENAKQVLQKSPRHGEWVDIKVPGKKDPLRAYVVYPERSDKAPVVLVIHEIFGLSDWVRGVADQLAADGVIAVAPDMLSGHGPNGGGSAAIGSEDNVRRVIGEVKRPEVMADLDYAIRLLMSGKKDPEFEARIRAESEKITSEVYEKHGLLDVAVPSIRSLRDGDDE